ncbi:MAG: hypothetical protein DRG11_07575 [Epsilonproteobacteria bacterium]|nr:MAG: hypothetical protein DRG11_07575 [Campylobacterota bacterium]
MKQVMKYSFRALLAVFIGLYFNGCVSKSISVDKTEKIYSKIPNQERSKPKAPEAFFVKVGIEDWKVVYNKILYDAHLQLGRVQVEGRYFYLDDVVLKLIATNFPMHFWVVKLPHFKEGEFELKAIKRRDPYYMTDIDESAPLQADLVVVLKNKIIVDHYLENIRPWWGTFNFYKIDKVNKRLFFTNSKYPAYLWACKYPTASHGTYKLDIRLIEERE